MIPKVLADITRQGVDGTDVLVFRYVHDPDAAAQVPGGTVEADKDLIVALNTLSRSECQAACRTTCH